MENNKKLSSSFRPFHQKSTLSIKPTPCLGLTGPKKTIPTASLIKNFKLAPLSSTIPAKHLSQTFLHQNQLSLHDICINQPISSNKIKDQKSLINEDGIYLQKKTQVEIREVEALWSVSQNTEMNKQRSEGIQNQLQKWHREQATRSKTIKIRMKENNVWLN